MNDSDLHFRDAVLQKINEIDEKGPNTVTAAAALTAAILTLKNYNLVDEKQAGNLLTYLRYLLAPAIRAEANEYTRRRAAAESRTAADV